MRHQVQCIGSARLLEKSGLERRFKLYDCNGIRQGLRQVDHFAEDGHFDLNRGRSQSPERPPVEEPPNEPQKPPVEEPEDPPGPPPPPSRPPVKEPPNEPGEPPVKEPPPKDPDREPPPPPIRAVADISGLGRVPGHLLPEISRPETAVVDSGRKRRFHNLKV